MSRIHLSASHGAALAAFLLLVGVPRAALNQGVADDHPQELRLVAADTAVIPAWTHGDWTLEPGHVALKTSADDKNNFWVPQDPQARFADGFVRARLTLGKRLDASLLFRLQNQDASDLPEISGYGITFDNGTVEMTRWEKGVPRPMEKAQKIANYKKRRALEINLWLIGPHLSAQVFDADSLELLMTFVVTDDLFPGGRLGLRAYHKQDAATALTYLALRPAQLEGRSAPSLVGAERFVWLNPEALSALPSRGNYQVLEKKNAAAQALIRTDRRGLALLRRAGVDLLDIVAEPRRAFHDSAYRRCKAQWPIPTEKGFAIDTCYKDAEMVEALLHAYHDRFPQLTELVHLGTSHRGRPILALRIRSPRDNPHRAAVMLNGAHHGLELLPTEYVLDAIQILLESDATDPQVKRWRDHLDIWAIPMVNPDGNQHYFDHSAYTGRKNGRDTFQGDGFSPAHGVDLNRNYPFRWATSGERGGSSRPRHPWYRGPAPGSEPETQALMALADAKHFVASISYHTLSTVILAPYTIDDVPNPEPNEAWTIAQEIADLTPTQPNNRRYRVQRNIYSVDGVDQDWFRAAHGTVALLIEGALHNPPSDERRRSSVELNRMTWMALFDRVLDGPSIYGHLRDSQGLPVVAEVNLAEVRLNAGEHWTSRCRDGRYERMLAAPGTYTVQVSSKGVLLAEQRVRISAGERRRLDFDLSEPPTLPLAQAMCPQPEMCAVATYCAALRGQCPLGGELDHCRIDEGCWPNGAAHPQAPCLRCDVRHNPVAWSPAPQESPCGDATCHEGLLTPPRHCDAAGTCTAPPPLTCAPYARCADPQRCATSCRDHSECLAGHHCSSGHCAPRPIQEVPPPPPARAAPPTPSETNTSCQQLPATAPSLSLIWALSLALLWRQRRRLSPHSPSVR